METSEQIPLSEKIISGMKKAVIELEEFRLQVALGKAEAHDVYEEAKKSFNKYLYEAKTLLEETKGTAKKKTTELQAILETLQVQLALGKAETKDAFEAQRKKITKALDELEEFIKKNKIANEYYTRLLLEVGKFRIKLNIIKMRFELNKLEARVEFEDKKKDLSEKLAEIKKRLLKNEAEAEDQWENFREGISDAYSHLKKTFAG
jgi:hypothetical protein